VHAQTWQRFSKADTGLQDSTEWHWQKPCQIQHVQTSYNQNSGQASQAASDKWSLRQTRFCKSPAARVGQITAAQSDLNSSIDSSSPKQGPSIYTKLPAVNNRVQLIVESLNLIAVGSPGHHRWSSSVRKRYLESASSSSFLVAVSIVLCCTSLSRVDVAAELITLYREINKELFEMRTMSPLFA
jgi:hypothetical protein